jgi:hypothetical protein
LLEGGWLNFADALDVVSRERDVGLQRARLFLKEACMSKRVQSRCIAPVPQRKVIRILNIPHSHWEGYVDLETGMYYAPFDEDNAHGDICEKQLREWLARSRKGPTPGTGRYDAADRKLFPEIKRKIDSGKAGSATEAARQLVEEGKVRGGGTADSRARRLAGAYRAAIG